MLSINLLDVLYSTSYRLQLTQKCVSQNQDRSWYCRWQMQICRRCCCGRTHGCLSGNRIWQCLLPSQPPAISLHIAAVFDFLDHHSLSLLCKSSGAKCSLNPFASSCCSLLPASVQPLKMGIHMVASCHKTFCTNGLCTCSAAFHSHQIDSHLPNADSLASST